MWEKHGEKGVVGCSFSHLLCVSSAPDAEREMPLFKNERVEAGVAGRGKEGNIKTKCSLYAINIHLRLKLLLLLFSENNLSTIIFFH